MQFSDIAGHHELKTRLKEMVDNGRIPHALMLSGVPGIGKMRLARALAQYIHCSDRSGGDSCGRCPSCIQHGKLMNSDVHFAYPVLKQPSSKTTFSTDFIKEWREMLESHDYMPYEQWLSLLDAGNRQPAIYVSQSEEILHSASLSALQEDTKIFIIWLPEKMNVDTANKLLKIIEEPFSDTLFIMVSNEPAQLLPTIRSRVQNFSMLPLSQEELSNYLTSRLSLPQTSASEAARLSGGRIGEAVELATRAEERHEFAELFMTLMRTAYAKRLSSIRDISEQIAAFGREKGRRFMEYCSRMTRENFIYNLKMPALSYMTGEEENFSSRFSPFIHEGNVENIASEFQRAWHDIGRNANARIVLFDLGVNLSILLRKAKPSPTTL